MFCSRFTFSNERSKNILKLMNFYITPQSKDHWYKILMNCTQDFDFTMNPDPKAIAMAYNSVKRLSEVSQGPLAAACASFLDSLDREVDVDASSTRKRKRKSTRFLSVKQLKQKHAEKLPTPEEVAALTGFSEVAKFFSSVGGDGAALEVARTAAKLCTPEPPKKEPGETQKEKPGEKVVENPSKDEVADNQSVPPFAKGDKCILSAVKQKEKYNGAECTIEVVQKAKCKIWIPKLSEFKLVPFDKLTLVSSAVNPTTVQSSDVAKPSDAAKLNAILGNDD